MEDTISKFLGITPLSEESLTQIQFDVDYEIKHNSVNIWGGGKGELNGFYGKRHTEETKKLMSIIVKGSKKPKPENFGVKEKNNFWGKTHTEETKRKISQNSKGNTNRLGISHTEETKNKISNSTKIRFQDETERKKISQTLTGRKASQETKDKMSKSQKGRVITEEHRQKISLSNKNYQRHTCIHCGISCQLGAHNRWHGDNCRNKTNGII